MKKKKKWLAVLVLVVSAAIIGGGAYAYSFYHSFNQAVKTIHDSGEQKQSEKRTKEIIVKNGDPFSILLLGVDERKNDTGRSDTMIVMTVNPHLKSINMLSIPRDTRTEIVGHGTVDKINHAYAFGDLEMSIKTVEKFLNIPIDYYVKVNMEGFEDIVDALGGVTVYNDFAFSTGDEYFREGELTLDGKKALTFARMRHDDPEGDLGRQKRQREIIESIIEKGSSITSLWKYDDIFEALSKNIKTNFSFDEIVGMQSIYKDLGKKIQEHKINGTGQMIANQQGNNVWYYIVSDEERQRITNILRNHLELSLEVETERMLD